MTDPPEPTWRRVLVVIGIITLAVNLRPAAVSVGPLLDEISHGLQMNGPERAALTALPVACFATVGAVTPALGRVIGPHRLAFVALLGVVLGLALRARVHDPALFLVLSFVSLAGMASANVLLPSLVKLHFPERVGTMTGVYSTALAIGLTLASVLTVPIAQIPSGPGIDWRLGLFVWAPVAAVAALPWLGLLRRDRRTHEPERRIAAATVARTRLGWAMALLFGLQSLQAYSIFGWFANLYRDHGFSAHTAGLLLGVITGVTIPLSWFVPRLTGRLQRPGALLHVLMGCYVVGYVGLLVAPRAGAWVWAVVVGIGTCTFPFVLTLIGLRARTPAGTAALSGFAQSIGYLIAIVGPFGVGLIRDATGGWTVPLLVLLALCVPQYVVGLAAARPRHLEDELTIEPTT